MSQTSLDSPGARTLDLLIVGAGPYGLATAAAALDHGLTVRVVGATMDSWRTRMPRGMWLRSPPQWHLDPAGKLTWQRYAGPGTSGRPLSRAEFVAYADWFVEQRALRVIAGWVERIEQADAGFVVHSRGGGEVRARHVLVTPGFAPFVHLPPLARSLPPGRRVHSTQVGDFGAYAHKRCLVIGGRQAAFETAVLLDAQPGTKVTVCARSPVPAFGEADWSWVDDHLCALDDDPGWFRSLSAAEQRAIAERFWAEGRHQLEPWLGERIANSDVQVLGRVQATAVSEGPDGAWTITLSDGQSLDVDEVVFATGFSVDLSRVPCLGGLPIATEDGYPVLTDHFESTVPGLFLTGMVATRHFGPFLGFVVGAPFAARTIASRIAGK